MATKLPPQLGGDAWGRRERTRGQVRPRTGIFPGAAHAAPGGGLPIQRLKVMPQKTHFIRHEGDKGQLPRWRKKSPPSAEEEREALL